MSAKQVVVVVDGSNLATEGRSTPSLAQLDDAVRAFAEEHPRARMIIVADATFEHRISKEERSRFDEAVEDGDVVTPPAGTIGRGDAFILKIAERAGAIVLSNDSFQEFHGEYDFLFEEGRLIGGKPVRGVGWIFAARNPVRGPKSRKAQGPAKRIAAEPPAPAPDESPQEIVARTSSRRRPTSPAEKVTAPKGQAKKAPVARAAAPTKVTAEAKQATRARGGADRPAGGSGSVGRRASRTATKQPVAKPVPAKGARTVSTKKKATPEPVAAKKAAPKTASKEPVNTVKAFQAFVAAHPLRSRVDGEVATFTSHGAMITVAMGRGMRVLCYAPLARLGRPAPTRARDVFEQGEHRMFRVAALDEERRIPEVGLL